MKNLIFFKSTKNSSIFPTIAIKEIYYCINGEDVYSLHFRNDGEFLHYKKQGILDKRYGGNSLSTKKEFIYKLENINKKDETLKSLYKSLVNCKKI